tara:strand:+ start:923 stop:1897 length:975 start_codon:yes stop_codon:yes gene_type:complete
LRLLVSLFCLLAFSSFLSLTADAAHASAWDGVYNQRLLMQRPTPKGDFQKLVVPVRSVGNLIIVEATIDGLRGNFILDTGAPYLVLNATYFRDYEEVPDFTSTDINGSVQNQKVARVGKLKINELYYENLEADVSDLSNIENKRGIKILGLLGLNLFMRTEMEIDIRAQQLLIYKVDRKGNRLAFKEVDEADYSLNFEMYNNAIIAPGMINGVELSFCFDTGAEAVLLDNNLPEEVYEVVSIRSRRALIGAGGGQTEVLYGTLLSLNFMAPLQACQVLVTDLELIGKAYGYQVAGFVGNDLLRQGVVSLNFRKKEMRINRYKGL